MDTKQPKTTTASHDKGTRLDAYSIKETSHGTVWTRCGVAFVNRDGSINLHLDVLPLQGRVHLRLPQRPTAETAAAAA